VGIVKGGNGELKVVFRNNAVRRHSKRSKATVERA
jgi:hypothetical protein